MISIGRNIWNATIQWVQLFGPVLGAFTVDNDIVTADQDIYTVDQTEF